MRRVYRRTVAANSNAPAARPARTKRCNQPRTTNPTQMAARFILRRFGFADKPEPRLRLVDGRRARPTSSVTTFDVHP
jgi:hypothetical protein